MRSAECNPNEGPSECPSEFGLELVDFGESMGDDMGIGLGLDNLFSVSLSLKLCTIWRLKLDKPLIFES